MQSIQSRLGTGLLISLIFLFALQWFVVSDSISELIEDYIASRLERDAELLLSAVQIDKSGSITINQSRIDPVYLQPFSGRYYIIATDDTSLRSRSLWDEKLDFVSLESGDTLRLRIVGPQNQSLLILEQGYHKQGRTLTISVTDDMTSIYADINRFQKSYAILSLVILFSLIVLQIFIVRAGMRPLERTRREIQLLELGDIQKLSSNVPTEISSLVKEINRLLTAMSQRLQRSRNALGNLAHALKTPLTLLTQQTNQDEIMSHGKIHTEILFQINIVRELVDRELKRARLAGNAIPGKQFDLKKEIAELITTLKTIYRDKVVDTRCEIPDGIVCKADREDMLELFGNLMDNAYKWADHQVLFSVEKTDGLVFTVQDDGPGCPEDKLNELANRGVRVDEQKYGHGLGLSIVKDVVQYYSGNISFGRSEQLGGFKVTVKIP